MQEHMEPKVTRDMLIGDVVSKYPAVADVFLSYGLHCVGCHVNAFESIEHGAAGHGMTDEEIEEMVQEANAYLAELDKPREGFSVTKKAVEKLHALAKEEAKVGWGLRLAVQPGGCSGYRYELEFEERPKQDDTVLAESFMIFMDKASAEALAGGSLDYVDSLHGSGFKIHNPNAKSHCGCGKSFS